MSSFWTRLSSLEVNSLLPSMRTISVVSVGVLWWLLLLRFWFLEDAFDPSVRATTTRALRTEVGEWSESACELVLLREVEALRRTSPSHRFFPWRRKREGSSVSSRCSDEARERRRGGRGKGREREGWKDRAHSSAGYTSSSASSVAEERRKEKERELELEGSPDETKDGRKEEEEEDELTVL